MSDNPYKAPATRDTRDSFADHSTFVVDAPIRYSGRITYEDQRKFVKRTPIFKFLIPFCIGYLVLLYQISSSRPEMLLKLGLPGFLLFGITALSVKSNVTLKRTLEKASRDAEFPFNEVQYEVTNEHFKADGNHSVTMLEWAAFSHTIPEKDSVRLVIRASNSAHVILKRWFDNEGDWHTIRELVTSRVRLANEGQVAKESP